MGRVRLYLVIIAAVGCLLAQEPKETQGMPARATPGDYQVQGKAGDFTIAAEFLGHSVPTSENILRVIEDRLSAHWHDAFPGTGPRLEGIRLQETKRNRFELRTN